MRKISFPYVRVWNSEKNRLLIDMVGLKQYIKLYIDIAQCS